ncbi:MAG: hypothetical protein CMJ23_01415 [Phycisphaerae bacterium]|nr:hypothetical protein [Phycisphaerae bacterium]
MPLHRSLSVLLMVVFAAAFVGGETSAQDLRRLRGNIRIDGSSTVYPITEAIAEAFKKAAKNVKVTVGVSGTGGGFKRFAANEIDISDASRSIKGSEAEACEKAGIGFIEIPVAYDGLTIVVSKENDWAESITVDELKRIFLTTDPASTWQDVRSEWPAIPLSIYSPGTDSGTFDYFKEVVAGKSGTIRSDMSVSEDDNVLVRGVAGDQGSIGFFGVAYYLANQNKLRALPVINKSGKAVMPTDETIKLGSYNPFSRPLFVYVNARSARKPHVRAFIKFYLENGSKAAADVGYVGLPPELYQRAEKALKSNRLGSQYLTEDGEPRHGALSDIYR